MVQLPKGSKKVQYVGQFDWPSPGPLKQVTFLPISHSHMSIHLSQKRMRQIKGRGVTFMESTVYLGGNSLPNTTKEGCFVMGDQQLRKQLLIITFHLYVCIHFCTRQQPPTFAMCVLVLSQNQTYGFDIDGCLNHSVMCRLIRQLLLHSPATPIVLDSTYCKVTFSQ